MPINPLSFSLAIQDSRVLFQTPPCFPYLCRLELLRREFPCTSIWLSWQEIPSWYEPTHNIGHQIS
jgi:hypothetical protein